MSPRQKLNFYSILAVAVLALVPVASADGPTTGLLEPLASVSEVSGAVVFRTSTGDGLTLTVTGENYRAQQRFGAGQTPSFAPVDNKGFNLPDGLFTWELVENPVLPAASAAASGKPANGRETHQMPAPDGRSQSGSFSIRNGRVVDANLTEPRGLSKPAAQLPEALRSEAADYHDADASDGSEQPNDR